MKLRVQTAARANPAVLIVDQNRVAKSHEGPNLATQNHVGPKGPVAKTAPDIPGPVNHAARSGMNHGQTNVPRAASGKIRHHGASLKPVENRKFVAK